MPGTDPAQAMGVIAEELPTLPRVPELPDRGPGADLTGRTAALLADIPVEVTPRGWRLTERPGHDLARARSMLSSDLDAMEEVLGGFRGPVKIQLRGPWTLAATPELPRTLNVAVADPSAVADLDPAVAEGAAAHLAELAKRLSGARFVVQFDEPPLPAVAGARCRPRSGLSRLAAVQADMLRERLAQTVASTGAYTVVHSCSTAVPFGIIKERQEAPTDARRRHPDLGLQITEADYRYYVPDSPTISDILDVRPQNQPAVMRLRPADLAGRGRCPVGVAVVSSEKATFSGGAGQPG